MLICIGAAQAIGSVKWGSLYSCSEHQAVAGGVVAAAAAVCFRLSFATW